MIIGILGQLGAGKTLLMTLLGYNLYRQGYKVYANYHLNFPYTYLQDFEDFDNIDVEKENVVLLDEIWTTADARRSLHEPAIQLSKRILQSRKKRSHILYTAQFSRLVDVRIRNITNAIFVVSPLLRDQEGIPVLLMVKVRSRDLEGFMVERGTKLVPCLGAHRLYDTYEVVEGMATDLEYMRTKQLKKIAEKYQDYAHLKKSELISLLCLEENLSKADAQLVANYIKIKNGAG